MPHFSVVYNLPRGGETHKAHLNFIIGLCKRGVYPRVSCIIAQIKLKTTRNRIKKTVVTTQNKEILSGTD